MKQFYSYIKVSPNPAVGDSLAIGILLYDGKKFRQYISDKKKKSASRLLSSNIDLDIALKGIVSKSKSIDKDQSTNKLFYDSSKYSTPSYFNYLSDYSNGIIQFSKPQMITGEMTDSNFTKLTDSLFPEDRQYYKSVNLVKASDSLSTVVTEKLISRVESLVHTFFNINYHQYAGLHFDYNMDVIGKNGTLVGAKVMSFDQNEQSLQLNLFKYNFLINRISPQDLPQQANNFFLISDEPDISLKRQHKLWESAVYNPVIKVLREEESNKVADLIISKKARTFLPTS